MKNKNTPWILGGIFVLILIIAIVSVAFGGSSSGEYDEFAKCLSASGVKMYGAYWCPHCQEQKKDFGNSWKHVEYIECSLPNNAGQTEICMREGITGYPTWEVNGQKTSGRLTLQQLSQVSGCALN